MHAQAVSVVKLTFGRHPHIEQNKFTAQQFNSATFKISKVLEKNHNNKTRYVY